MPSLAKMSWSVRVGLLAGASALAFMVNVGAASASTNLITDGQFNDVAQADTNSAPGSGSYSELSAGADPSSPASASGIPGWTVTSGSVDWQNAPPNGPDSDNPYSVDLNGSGAGTLEQSGISTASGQTYALSFELSANSYCGPQTKTLDVKWNGNTVGSFRSSSPSNLMYVRQTAMVTGTGSGSRDTLDFVSTTSDACGPVIGDISLVAASSIWNLSQDFPASADGTTAPANPGPDAYGDSGVWGLGYGGGGTYSTDSNSVVTGYSGLTAFTQAPSTDWQNRFILGNDPGVEAWQSGVDGYPYVGQNTTTSAEGLWPAGVVFGHPDVDTNTNPRPTVEWVSPITGTVSIDAKFSRLDCGGDGIDYSVDDHSGSNYTNLAAGIIFGCSGTASYTQDLTVVKGETLFFSSGDGGYGSIVYDSTQFQVTITSTTSTGGTADQSIAGTPAAISATEGQALPGSTQVASFVDPDTGASASDYTATIDWGDGTTSQGTVNATGTPGSFSVTGGPHTYSEDGSKPVAVYVTDKTGSLNHATITSTPTVSDALLTGGGATPASQSSLSFSGTVATFTDAYTSAPLGDYSATIDWGDGTASQGTVNATVTPGSYTVSGSHAYAAAGSYHVSVTMTDAGGSSTTNPTNSTTITVTGSPSVSVKPKSLSWAKTATTEQYVTILNAASATGNAQLTSIKNSGATVFSIDSKRSTCAITKALTPGHSCRVYEKISRPRGTPPKSGWAGTLAVKISGASGLKVPLHAS